MERTSAVLVGTLALLGLVGCAVDSSGIGTEVRSDAGRGGSGGIAAGGAGGSGGGGGGGLAGGSGSGGRGGSGAGGGLAGAGGNPDAGLDLAPPIDGPGGAGGGGTDGPGERGTLGQACSAAAQCASGFCVDGVCCDGACQGICQACLQGKTGQEDGRCRPMPMGSDPDDECVTDPGNFCGRTGVCNGAAACAFAPSGLACGESMCSGSTLTPRPRCNGVGTCEARAAEACPGSLNCANGSVCKANCVSDGDCATGAFCNTADGRCRMVRALGASCSDGGECGSGHCVDGVCCQSACAGLCTACTQAKTGQASGQCAPVRAGVDPDNECERQDPASCGRDGTCDGAGACRLHPDGTQCASACCDRTSGPGGGRPRPCTYQCRRGSCDTQNPTVEEACGLFTCCCPSGNNGQAACVAVGACAGTCQ